MPSPQPVGVRTTDFPDGRAIIVGVGLLVLCWMLLMPPGAGPDEPGHLVRSGAVIRGNTGDADTYALPDRYQTPEPGCYAFQPTVPVGCTSVPEHAGVTVDLPTRAGEYPIWGHGLFGILTLLPGLDPIWWARLGGGIVAALLVGISLTRTAVTSPTMTAGLLIGVTPMAWSTFGTVNPSSLVIAGAVAVWTGMLTSDADAPPRMPILYVSAGWLTAIGWAALVLPRRDGLVWACLTLVIALAASGMSTADWFRSLTRAQQAVIVVPTVATVIWGAFGESRSTQFVVLAPVAVAVAEAIRWWWNRPAQTPGTRLGSAAVLAAVGALAGFVLVGLRPGGWDTDLALDVVMQTDDNLVEAIGVFGWLDTAVPAGVIDIWLIAVGMLVAAALLSISGRSSVLWATALVGTAAVTSWVLELVQGNTTGLYWQGRYSIPLLVGIPMLLAFRRDDHRADHRVRSEIVGRVVGVAALFILNVGAWAAARRFGVGLDGSYLPWNWDTAIQPVPPLVLLLVHGAATIWLAGMLLVAPPPPQPDAG